MGAKVNNLEEKNKEAYEKRPLLFHMKQLPTWLHFAPTISVQNLQTTSSCRLL